jgi:hypothetical protein
MDVLHLLPTWRGSVDTGLELVELPPYARSHEGRLPKGPLSIVRFILISLSSAFSHTSSGTSDGFCSEWKSLGPCSGTASV